MGAPVSQRAWDILKSVRERPFGAKALGPSVTSGLGLGPWKALQPIDRWLAAAHGARRWRCRSPEWRVRPRPLLAGHRAAAENIGDLKGGRSQAAGAVS